MLDMEESAKQNFNIVDFKFGLPLLVCFCFIAGLALWGFYGDIPHYVEGRGMVLQDSVMVKIFPNKSGTVSLVNVAPGVKSEKGYVAMKFTQTSLSLDIRNKETELRAERDALEDMESFSGRRGSLEDSQLQNERKNTERTLALAKNRERELGEQLEDYEELFQKKYIGSQQYYSFKNDYNTAVQTVMDLQKQLDSLPLNKLDSLYQREQTKDNIKKRIRQAEADLSSLQEQYSSGIEIKNPVRGTITEIYVMPGDPVTETTALYEIEVSLSDARNSETWKGLEIKLDSAEASNNGISYDVVGYIGFRDGANVKVGMPALVRAGNVDENKFGSIKATVIWKSNVPVSSVPAGYISRTADQAKYLVENDPVRYGIRLKFDRNADGSIAWTSQKGPDDMVVNQATCGIQVKVRSQLPIELLIPYLKSVFLGTSE
jgi:HlyD family secretion protein